MPMITHLLSITHKCHADVQNLSLVLSIVEEHKFNESLGFYYLRAHWNISTIITQTPVGPLETLISSEHLLLYLVMESETLVIVSIIAEFGSVSKAFAILSDLQVTPISEGFAVPMNTKSFFLNSLLNEVQHRTSLLLVFVVQNRFADSAIMKCTWCFRTLCDHLLKASIHFPLCLHSNQKLFLLHMRLMLSILDSFSFWC